MGRKRRNKRQLKKKKLKNTRQEINILDALDLNVNDDALNQVPIFMDQQEHLSSQENLDSQQDKPQEENQDISLSKKYYENQLKPLIDSRKDIATTAYSMVQIVIGMQGSAFKEKRETKHALELCYKMLHEVDDIMKVLERKLKNYLNFVNKNDKDWPPLC